MSRRSSGCPGFLDDLRAWLKDGSFRPLPVRERKIPKPGGSGKVRRLGIPTVADRVVQAALKLVLEPIFEADFEPVSYGFRPKRRAQDAIAEIHLFGTQGYRWVLDADIEACFDSISPLGPDGPGAVAGQGQAGAGLVKAFLKAGVLTELGDREDTHTGTPQGGILSPLLANIALSVLDEHLHAAMEAGRDDVDSLTCVVGAASRACRTGESSATRTISSCSCTVTRHTSKPCAKTSPTCSNPWDFGSPSPRPRSCT